MYAILFDLNTNYLNEQCEESIHQNDYKLIKDFMVDNGFTSKHASLYFGSEKIDAVSCVLVVQKLIKKYPWISTCINEVSMIRIEEVNDLMEAII